MKDINGKHVTVIVTFLVTTAGLVALGKDVAAFVVVGLAILGGIGVVISKQAETKQETQVIREQTNGANTALVNHLVDLTRESQSTNRELMAIIDRLGAQLAASSPGPAELPAAPTSPAPEIVGSNGAGTIETAEQRTPPLGFAAHCAA